MFAPQVYIERRRRLLEGLSSGLALFLGNEESPMNYLDNTYRSGRTVPSFIIFGLNQPSLAAIVDADEGTETIYGDDFTVDDIVWRAPQPTIAGRALMVGVDRTASLAKLADVLAAPGPPAGRSIFCRRTGAKTLSSSAAGSG